MIKKGMTLIIAGVLLSVFPGILLNAQNIEDLKYPKLNKINIPKIEKVTLDNGLRLYLLEDKSLPLFNINVRVNCGSYLESAEKVGLASICGDVLRTGGTEKWTGDEIDEILEGVGATVETYIDQTSGGAFVNVLNEYTDLGLEVLAEILRRPIFDQDKIDISKMQERTNISRRNDDIASLARREYAKLIYGKDSPYARQTEYKTIDAISRDDLVVFHKTYYHPENIQMAIWGDFDSKEIKEKINQYFGSWERGNVPVPPLPEVNYEWRSKVYYIEKTDAKQSYVRMGHIGGLVTDNDYTDRIVMNSILGGGFGSRVTDNVRTKMGLAYSTGGRYISNYSYPGYFFLLASTKPQSTMQAIREMIKQTKSMQTEPATEEEMQKGKDGYLNSFVFNFDNRREVVGRLMDYDFYGLPENFLEMEKEGVEKVTPEAVMTAARNNLHPNEMVILVVGNAAEFEEPLENLGLGPVDTIDITIPSGEEEKELAITPENLARGKEIMAEAVKAAGGSENINKIKSMSVKGTISISTPQGDFPFPLESIDVFPDKNYTLLTMMGNKMIDIRNGDVGWKTDQSGQLVAKTSDEIAKENDENKRNTIMIFQGLESPAYRAVYDGTGNSNDIPCEFVALIDENQKQFCRLAVNAESFELIGKYYWGQTPMGEGNIEQIFSNYKDASGVKIPLTTISNLNGQKVTTLDIAEYEINPEISPDIFEKPQE